jgi:hypothetical protein
MRPLPTHQPSGCSNAHLPAWSGSDHRDASPPQHRALLPSLGGGPARRAGCTRGRRPQGSGPDSGQLAARAPGTRVVLLPCIRVTLSARTGAGYGNRPRVHGLERRRGERPREGRPAGNRGGMHAPSRFTGTRLRQRRGPKPVPGAADWLSPSHSLSKSFSCECGARRRRRRRRRGHGTPAVSASIRPSSPRPFLCLGLCCEACPPACLSD